MCGRVRLPEDISEIKQDLKIEWDKLGDYQPHWNVPPTADLPVVTYAPGGRTLEKMRWGLIPAWAKDLKIGVSTFNARSDSIDTKPAFRQSWKMGRRCLVVTDGYYEWRKTDKQPFAMALGNRGPMILAGLWDTWKGPEGVTIKSVAVITTEASERLAQVHDRMPVLLDPDQWAAWLGELNSTSEELKAMLKPYPAERMAFWPVDKRVGNVRNDQRDLADPIALLV